MEGVSCSFGHGFRKFGYGDHAPLTEPLPKLRSMWKGPSRPTVDMEGGPSRPTVDMEGIVVLTRYNFYV